MKRTAIATILLSGLCLGLLSGHVTAQQRQPDSTVPGSPAGAGDATTGGQPLPMFGPPPPATRLDGLAAHPRAIQRPIITAADGTTVIARDPDAVARAIEHETG